MLGSCASWLPYVLTGLIGLATAYWIWGGRKTAAVPMPRVVEVDTPPVSIPPVAAAIPVAAAVAGTAAIVAAVKAKPKVKPVAVKVAPAPKPKAAPFKKLAVKAAPVKAAPVKAVPVKATPVKLAVAPKPAAPKAKAAPVKKIAVKPAALMAAPKPKPAAKVVAKPAAKVPVKPVVKPAVKDAVKPKVAPKAVPKPAAKPKAAPKPKIVIPDNLELLKGVGPKLNSLLKSLGVSSFEQVANWKPSDVREIDSKLGNFAGRIGRDNWIDQAKLLMKGDVKGFEKKYGPLGSEIKR